MNVVGSASYFEGLLAVLEHAPNIIGYQPEILIIDGVRAAGKTTLAEKLAGIFEVPLFQIFKSTGGRKGTDWVGLGLDTTSTSFASLDAISQCAEPEEMHGLKAVIDRGYISTAVFNGYNHSRMTFANKQWRECKVLHIHVRTCQLRLREVAETRLDCAIGDLSREQRLFTEMFKVSGTPHLRYDNWDLCRHGSAEFGCNLMRPPLDRMK